MQAEAAATSPKPFKDAPEVSGEPVAAGGLPAAAAMLLEWGDEWYRCSRAIAAVKNPQLAAAMPALPQCRLAVIATALLDLAAHPRIKLRH